MRIKVETSRRMFDYGYNDYTYTTSGLEVWGQFKELIQEEGHSVVALDKNDLKLLRRYITETIQADQDRENAARLSRRL